MRELLRETHAAVMAEYNRAALKHGKANKNGHESYSLILEEYEEAVSDGDSFYNLLEEYWQAVKRNMIKSVTDKKLTAMGEFAEHAAAEWIQVAAMYSKAQR